MDTATSTASNVRQTALPSPSRPEHTAQRSSGVAKPHLPDWLRISRSRAELIVAGSMITLVGMNDSSTGANLSSMQATYGVTYEKISLVFLSNVAGYLLSCITSSFILQYLGLRRGLLVAAFGMGTGCLILTFAPPYPIFVCSLAFLGFGSGVYDTFITTLVSHSEDGTMMSLLYSGFGVGAMTSPLLIGGFVDRGIPWNKYYYIPLSITLGLAVIGHFVFAKYQPPADETTSQTDIPMTPVGPSTIEAQRLPEARVTLSLRTKMIRVLRMRAVWVGFLLIVLSFAIANTLSAWLVSFMIQKRSSPAAESRYLLSGLWGGIALGRVILAFLAKRMGERSFSILVLALASTALGIVWGVPSFQLDAVALAVTGFFLGPITPGIISAISQRVPPSLKSSVVSLTIGVGLIGSSLGPLAFGIVASKGGLSSLPAVLIGTSSISALGWLLIPANTRRED